MLPRACYGGTNLFLLFSFVVYEMKFLDLLIQIWSPMKGLFLNISLFSP